MSSTTIGQPILYTVISNHPHYIYTQSYWKQQYPSSHTQSVIFNVPNSRPMQAYWKQKPYSSSSRSSSLNPDTTAFIPAPLSVSHHTHRSAFFHRSSAPRRPRRAVVPRATATTANVITEDHVIQFQTSGRRKLGRVLRPDGKRNWIVEDTTGVHSSVSPKQVTYVVGPASTLGEVPLYDLETSCTNLATESTELLEVAWELISSGEGIDGSNTATVQHIARIVYDDISPESLFTTYILLSKDDVFFKERNIKGQSLYEARKLQIVQESRAQKLAFAERERESNAKRDALIKACQQRDEKAFRLILGEDAETVISCLMSMAVELDAGPHVDERYGTNRNSAFQQMTPAEQILVRKVMTHLEKPLLPSSAMHILVSLRIFSRHENLSLRRADLLQRRIFSETLLQAADRLIVDAVKDVDEDRRIDLSHFVTFAIDSEDTTEIDDAISWDAESGRILVHVADPTRYFPDGPTDPLVVEAMHRASTLYLPTEKLTMFPDALASDLFSLNGQNSDGSALTFGFRIQEDGNLDEESMTVQPTVISSPLRLTYEQLDAVLADETHEFNPVLKPILDKAKLRKNWRIIEGGAIIVKSPFAEVDVENPTADEPKVQLRSIDTDRNSWVLVSELMITACTVGALMAENARIPVPFRGQEPFDYPPDEVLEAIPDGPARAAMAFRNASPSEMKTEPIEHASLGLDSYLQVTSPIRRSTDLLTHFQLKSHLRGEDLPYGTEDVNRAIARSADVGKTLRGVENRTRKYWQFEYLRRMGPKVLHKATFVKPVGETKPRLGFFSLDEYGMQITAYTALGLRPGASTEVKVNVADPRTGTLRAECINQAGSPAVAEIDKLLQDAFSDIED